MSDSKAGGRRGDPILRAHRTAAAHRRRAAGVLGTGGRVLLVLFGIVALTLVFRPVFLGFLDDGTSVANGVGAAVLRLAVVVVGLAGIDVYEVVIRGRDREVLALLPVDPAAVVRASMLGLLGRRWWLVPGLGALLLPVAIQADPVAWIAGTLALLGVLAFAWPAAAVINLLAVDVAGSPAWGPLLDLVRGANPRAQAAFVYGPGLLLVLGSGVVYAASAGVAWSLSGQPLGSALIAVGPALGLVMGVAVPALARRGWFRASAVLSEIDAAYAGLVDADQERLHVYLDWALRFLPTSLRRDALHDLRHGWRARRLWISGAWGLGIAGILAGWTQGADGPARALAVAALAAALVASVILAFEADEPEFLRWWLPRDAGRALAARFVVVWAWAQPAVALPAAIVAFMHDWAAAGLVLALAEATLLLVIALALGCARLGRTGPWLYGAVSTGLVAALVLLFAAGGYAAA